MPRKVIQVTYFGGNDNYSPELFALCDDGTIWSKWWPMPEGNEQSWTVIDEVPQEKLSDLDLGEATCGHCGLMKRNKYSACNSCGSKHNK